MRHLFAGFALAAATAASAQTIDTYMGAAVGDGGPALHAQLVPVDVAYDGAGNLLIAEPYRVRKVTPDGSISTIAGIGLYGIGSGCDGHIALTTALNGVNAIALDSAGNVYVSAYVNSCIEKITPEGFILPVAGTGHWGFSGDGGPALSADLNGPSGLAIDGQGNIYVSDLQNNRVRKIDSAGIITTVAGSGAQTYSGDGGPAVAAGLFFPTGLALDALGNLYIADSYNGAVRKVDANGIISTVARVGIPEGLHVDRQGALLIAAADGVMRIAQDGSMTFVAGSDQDFGFSGDGGPASAALVWFPYGVTLDPAGDIVFADSGNGRIRKIDAQGIIDTIAGGANYPDGTPVAQASLSRPNKIAFDRAGNLLIADAGDRRVRKVRADGTVLTIAGKGAPESHPDSDGPALQATFSDQISVAVDAEGNVVIGDGNSLRKVDASGNIHSLIRATAAYTYPPLGCSWSSISATSARFSMGVSGLAIDDPGNIYFADPYCNVVRKLDTDGVLTLIAGNGTAGFAGDGGAATDAELNQPSDVLLDGAGNLFISDAANQRVRKVDAIGNITTVAGSGAAYYFGDGGAATQAGLCGPDALALDDENNLYIADACDVVRRVTPAGTISTVAGNGAWGFSGDGGPATSATFDYLRGLAVHGGMLYIADQDNSRIRRVQVSDTVFNATFER